MNRNQVLLTGISGFIAGHVALQLLDAGFSVRGTVRSLRQAETIREAMVAAGADVGRLSFVEADLTADDGWFAAAEGCRFVLHTASPFPAAPSRDRLALMPAAEGGTMRVIAAAVGAGVERVVLTSSAAAMYSGHPPRADEFYGEADWSDTDSPTISGYALSKTLAERAAWKAAQAGGVDLVALNPTLVLGPLSGPALGTSAALVAAMMRGRMLAVPDLAFALADVRDVAEAHLAAMTVSAASGRRFALSSGTLTLREIGQAVAKVCPTGSRSLPRWRLPNAVVRVAAMISPQARAALPELGRRKRLDTGPARDILGLRFRDPEEAIGAMARSLVSVGAAG
ncbi:NAD-dependent epimerase/dehydratase family protein [Aurantimonas sp. A2-1-M11]|uniref:NAD-dependent epimerase/dehydratase family protein n=1 Tax=Aurantimonas sp. A2-1-M11 TaxID=3113712 RepID=UPI002F9458E0